MTAPASAAAPSRPGRFGPYGGQYVPETLMFALDAGFKVMHLPGHAPGLIGLFRETDRLALVSDCFYTLDPQTGLKGATREVAMADRAA